MTWKILSSKEVEDSLACLFFGKLTTMIIAYKYIKGIKLVNSTAFNT